MGLKPGYKQTEVGVIPEDWEVSTLGELCVTSSGTTPARSIFDRYYRNGSVHWVKTLDLNNSEVLDTDELVTKEAIEETSLRVYPMGTVLIAMYGGFNQIGRTGLLRIPAAVNQAITAVQPQAGRLLPEYLLATLNFKVNYWKTVASSSRKDPNITSQDIRAFPIACPHLAEQEAIAEALSDVDALIESLEQLIAKKRQVQQGAMQELLTGKRRLRGFDNETIGYKRTEVGMIPEDWDVSTVGDEFSIQLGKMLDSEKNIGVPKPYIGNRAVQWGRIELDDISFIKMTPLDLQRFRLRDGDLLVCEGGEIGRAAIWKEQIPECYYQKALHRLRSKRGYRADLLLWMLERWRATGFLANFVTQTSIAHLPKEKFEKVPVPLPAKAEQDAIAAILSDMDAEIVELEAKLAKARRLKQGMMHNLLTGSIRLI